MPLPDSLATTLPLASMMTATVLVAPLQRPRVGWHWVGKQDASIAVK